MKRLHGSYGAANPSFAEAKARLRREMRALRQDLAKAAAESAVSAALHFLPWSAGVSPADQGRLALRRRVVATYVPQGSELDPAPLAQTLLTDGWTVCLPRAATRDSSLTFHAANLPLTPDAFGIPAPQPESERLTPSLVIVPVLAFDRLGGRLGQGAGCYDRAIADLRASRAVRVIGLAYAGQEVDHVPTEPHDQRLDGILTDTGFIEVLKPSA